MSAHKERQPDTSGSICHQFPLRNSYMVHLVLPPNLSKAEAERLCAFVVSLSLPKGK